MKLPLALQNPNFRAFWGGTLISVIGFQMLRFTQFWLIYDITDSSLYIGYLALANGIPTIVFNIIGGVYADRLNQKVLVFITQLLLAVLIFVLFCLTFMGVVNELHILILAFLSGSVEAFDQPARRALYPSLIDREAIPSGVALLSGIWPGTRIIAPAIAGFLIVWTSVATTILISAIGFLIMAIIAINLKVNFTPQQRSTSPLEDLLEGFTYIKAHSIFRFIISITFFQSFFALAYIPMMPVIAKEVLSLGPEAQGVLLGASGLGALSTTIVIAIKPNLGSKFFHVVIGSFLSGLSVVFFALSTMQSGSYYLAIVCMFIVGIFGTLPAISAQSSLQLSVPNNLRGRIMGLYGLTFSLRPLSGFQAGVISGFTNPTFAIAFGGAALSIFTVASFITNKNVRNFNQIIDKQ
jgi:MFS family permease